jgi:predicted transcriptional regulator
MDTTLKVDSATRDRLAALAEARGTTMRRLIEEYAEQTLTPEELRQRGTRTAEYLAEHFGITVTEESSTDVLRSVRGQVVAHYAAERGAA